MKTIVGVDNQGVCTPAIHLLNALRFPGNEITLLHAVKSTVPFVPFSPEAAVAMQAEYGKVVHNLGLAALDKAKDECCARSLKAKSQLVSGGAVESITWTAQNVNADLVAVGAKPRSLWSPSFIGSVSRGLAIASPTSLLIAKGTIPEGRKLRAVIATDHSDYANRCIERFFAMRPGGILEITVVSAYEVQDHEAEVLRRNLPSIPGSVEKWIEDRVGEKNCDLVDRLAEAGYVATCRVIKGDANDAIRRTMQDSQADLLILGAQGHGFMDRVLIGSVSLHQAIYEPYPVLIVRV